MFGRISVGFLFSVGIALTHFLHFFSLLPIMRSVIHYFLALRNFLNILISNYRSKSPAQAALFVFIGQNQAEPAGILLNLSFSSSF